MFRYTPYWFLLIITSFTFYKYFLFPLYYTNLPKSIDDSSVNKYKKNKWTRQEIKSDDKYYTYSYKFKDHNRKTRIWTWNAPKLESDRLIENYGFPKAAMKGYKGSKKEFENLCKKSYLYIDKIGPVRSWNFNYNDLISDSRPLVTGIADIIKRTAKEEKLKMREVVDLILAFCQDIPYGIPPQYTNEKLIMGLHPPPLGLNNGWIDCDSKAVLFASIYTAITSAPIVLVHVPRHLFVGVPAIPGPYDNTVSYRGKDYIIAEQTGTMKVHLGHIGLEYAKVDNITPVEVTKNYVRPKLPIYSNSKVLAGNTLLITLKEENAKIFKKLRLYYRFTKNGSWDYARLKPMSDHSLKFSITDVNENIELKLKSLSDGYYYSNETIDISKNDYLTLDFSDDKCIYIKSKPLINTYLFSIGEGKSKANMKKTCKTDSSGIFRAIMPSGYYLVSLNKNYKPKMGNVDLSLDENKKASGFKYYDRENNIGIRFDI